MTEVLIAVFILAIGLVGILSLFPVGIDAVSKMVSASNSAAVCQTAMATLEYEQIARYVAADATYTTTQAYHYPVNATGEQACGVPGLDQYSWTAALLPIEMFPNDTTRRLMKVQVAVFRNRAVSTGNQATFANGTNSITSVTIGSGTLRTGDYIRHANHGIWYRVISISGTTAGISQQYQEPTAAGAPLDYSGNIVATFETMLSVH